MTDNLIEGVEDVDNKEIVLHRKDGSKVYALLTINSAILDNRRLFINSLIDITKQISSREEVGISFLQVGSDNAARRFLKELDDGLEGKGAKFDIVDTKNFDELQNGSVEDIIIGALTD